MPIWLRRFVFNKLKEFHQEKETTDIKQSPIINRPDVAASYTTRASRK
jgi:hypothetical protein